jgi:hypothetical protein
MTNTQRAYNRLEKLNLSIFNESAIRDIIGELSLSEFSEGLERGSEIEKNAHNIVNR